MCVDAYVCVCGCLCVCVDVCVRIGVCGYVICAMIGAFDRGGRVQGREWFGLIWSTNLELHLTAGNIYTSPSGCQRFSEGG